MDTREKLPDTRASVTHKAVILSSTDTGELWRVKFFFTVGLYPDGRPAELFLHMDEAGSTLDGFADSFSIVFSLALQAGVPLRKLVEKLAWQEFEPKGPVELRNADCGLRNGGGDQKPEAGGRTPDGGAGEIRQAKSVVDYVVRWMEGRFV